MKSFIQKGGVGLGDPRLPAAFPQPGTSSFSDFLAEQAPDLLPGRRAVPQGHAGDLARTAPPSWRRRSPAGS